MGGSSIQTWSRVSVIHNKEIHVSTAQRYAHAAFRDGLEEDTIRDIASLACWGRHMQNAERDLHRWIPHAFDSQLERFTTVIEVYDPDTAEVQQRSIPILLASDVLHAIWRKQSGVLWDNIIGATPEKCKLYWDLAADEWASEHPVVQPFVCIFYLFNTFPLCHENSKLLFPLRGQPTFLPLQAEPSGFDIPCASEG